MNTGAENRKESRKECKGTYGTPKNEGESKRRINLYSVLIIKINSVANNE